MLRRLKHTAYLVLSLWLAGTISGAILWQERSCNATTSIKVASTWPFLTMGLLTQNPRWYVWIFPAEEAYYVRCHDGVTASWLRKRRLRQIYGLDRI